MSEAAESIDAGRNATNTINGQASGAGNSNDLSVMQSYSEESPNPEFHPPLEQSASYFSLSSQSSTNMSPPANASSSKNFSPITPGNSMEERNTIESSAKMPLRKDSDDISLSKIKPVHNFFGQHPVYPYDSDGSDGSLVFSPGSVVEDHKTPNLPLDNNTNNNNNNSSSSIKKDPPFGKRSDSFSSQRGRFSSVDSVASNGSIRYVRPSPVQPSSNNDAKPTSTEPINPQLLPYNERRKLIQQRQYEEQHQQYQQYHAAMMHVHNQASQQQQPQPGHQSHPSHPPPPYQMDPRYYQMYGMPPPGMYAMPPGQQQQPGMPHGYPYFPPPQPYYPMPTPTSGSPTHTQLHPSVQQFGSPQQFQTSAGSGYQPYPPPMMVGPPGSMPPQYAYYQPPPPPPPPPPPMSSPDATQQREKQIRSEQKPPQPPSDRSRKEDNKTSSTPSSSTKSSTAKSNKPLLPPTATRRGSGSNSGLTREVGTTSTIPIPPLPSQPPLPPPPSMGNPSFYHSRADSYGSMSTLGSQSGSFSKDEDDEVPPTETEPSTPKPTVDTTLTVGTPETPKAGHVRKNSFLDMLRNNWSPKSQASPILLKRERVNVSEFHRKNQEFLNRANALPPMTKSPTALGTPPMHRRVGSEDRPPASRGTHRRLQSISNDEWEEGDNDKDETSDSTDKDTTKKSGNPADLEIQAASAISGAFKSFESDGLSDSGTFTDEDRFTSDDGLHDEYNRQANEMTSLLPPSGISSNEQEGKNNLKYSDRKSRRESRSRQQQYDATASSSRKREHKRSDSNDFNQILGSMGDSDRSAIKPGARMSETTVRWDNRTSNTSSRKSRKKKYRHKSHKYSSSGTGSSSESSQDDSDSDFDHRKWTKKRSRMLEKERAKLIEQWKAEAREEAELLRKEEEANRWHRRCFRKISEQMRGFGVKTFRFLTLVERFIGNLPLTIGAVALAIVTLGVVWFKFAEEYLETCERVHFHSSQCTFPEFPGCFYCDRSAIGYKIAVGFHYACTIMSGLLAMLLVAKILLATRVVIDEMSSPTTSSPAGLLCMTSVCVFAGRGMVGQVIVSTAACVHLALAIWFIYMALAYNIMPEPSWFPNTVGIGLSAVKTWLYYPMPGHLLMAISLSLNFFFFPISLIRVVVNEKISATVAWMQMSAPAVSLYALTIMAQPSFEEEQPDVTNFQRVHRMVYLPCMHVMCGLSLLGMAASLQSLYVRWADFKGREFSPAHAAFCFPTLSHANAIQSYRGAVMSFSQVPPRSWRMFILDAYWIVVLVGGTIATIWICGKFLYMLPEWTSLDLSNEEEPPAPYETLLSQQHMVTAGDSLTQNFVSPAILQANETGALILSRSARDGTLRYVRTRRIRALGFEPTMNWSEMQEEREKLLEWVGKHPARRRHRTLSVPGIDFNYGSTQPAFGTGNTGVYAGNFSPSPNEKRRSMSQGAFFGNY